MHAFHAFSCRSTNVLVKAAFLSVLTSALLMLLSLMHSDVFGSSCCALGTSSTSVNIQGHIHSFFQILAHPRVLWRAQLQPIALRIKAGAAGQGKGTGTGSCPWFWLLLSSVASRELRLSHAQPLLCKSHSTMYSSQVMFNERGTRAASTAQKAPVSLQLVRMLIFP